MLTNRGLILGKPEVTYGTDAVPTAAANAILAGNVQVSVDGNLLTREYLRESISQLSAFVGRKLVRVTFETEIKGSGAAGTAPRHGFLNRMCAMSEVIVGGTSVTYAPISSGFESGDIYAYMDGILHKITGVYGSKKISLPGGQFGKFSWEMQGLFNLPIDAGIAAGAVFDATVPQMVQSQALTLGGYTPIAAALEIDLGVQIGERPDLNSAEGLKGLLVRSRQCRGSIDPEAVIEATHTFWANFKNGTLVALAGNLLGSVAGNKVAFTAPKVQYESIAWTDRNGQRAYNTGLRFTPTTDILSDELAEVYT